MKLLNFIILISLSKFFQFFYLLILNIILVKKKTIK